MLNSKKNLEYQVLPNAKFDEEAYAFYTGQILLEARREAKVTQSELAKRINATKSYISRIENGSINQV